MDRFEIEYNASYSYSYLNITFETEYGDDKVIEMDITKRLSEQDEDGKTIPGSVKYCIEDDKMETISSILHDMTYNRVRPFENSELVVGIFDQLPEKSKLKLFEKLYDDLDYDDQETFFTKLNRNRKLDELI